MREIAISDIHGCCLTFKELLHEQVKLTKEDKLYLLGDYVDRGPDSKGVIDYILSLQSDGYSVQCLRGNHEQAMLDSVVKADKRKDWLSWGGDTTLESYHIDHPALIPERHMNFLNQLGYYIECDHFYLVHAGFNFKHGNPFQDIHSMLWIRRAPVDANYLNGKKIIHGHTPMDLEDIEDQLRNEQLLKIDIDAGCAYLHVKGLGNLCAYDFTNQQFYFQPNIEKFG